MKKITTEKHKRVREIILRLLQKEYPHAVDSVVLRYAIDSLGYPLLEKEFDGHIEYLKEKGYIKKEVKGHSNMKIVLLSISAKGIDLLDGIESERGVWEE